MQHKIVYCMELFCKRRVTMDETVIVIMLKDKKTGFLEKELGCYHLGEQHDIMLNIYAEEDEQNNITVFLKLTCETDVSDWEYNAILDYYDTETVKPFVDTIEELEEEYNPVWLVSFPFLQQQQMEQKLCLILQAHQKELNSVYEAIADKKDDYIE